jgi:hypothetical protein
MMICFINGYIYIIIIIVDYSRYGYLYLIIKKTSLSHLKGSKNSEMKLKNKLERYQNTLIGWKL